MLKWGRQISILNTEYYEFPFVKLRVGKIDIMITKLSKNSFTIVSRIMNIKTWKAYLRNSYYEYELSRNLATRSKNRNIYSRFFI